MNGLQLLPLRRFPRIDRPFDLGEKMVACLQTQALFPRPGDVLVVAHKIISKAEGAVVDLATVTPSENALKIAARTDKDPALVEVILRESNRVVRQAGGVLICEHRLGMICANAGVDRSNAGVGQAVLLPKDPDRSAAELGNALKDTFGSDIGVLVADTHGRPWREGATGVCIGLAGIHPFLDYRGCMDLYDYEMQTEIECLADEICAAATLVMGQGHEGLPAVLLRGGNFATDPAASAGGLLREQKRDLFR